MPEMPEVQTVVNDLIQAGIIGTTFDRAEVLWNKTLANMDEASFNSLLHNQKIMDLSRRGKYIIFTLSSGYFISVHLRMTGRLLLSKGTPELSPYIRLRIHLKEHATLDYYDTRKFGRWHLVNDLNHVVGHIGLEPLDNKQLHDELYTMLQSHKRPLKPLLLDQSFLAGLGNIYVDEALWDAKLHPLLPANMVTKKDATILYNSICKVLKRGIDSQGTTLGSGKTNYYRLDGTKGSHQTKLMVFRRTGHECPRCGNIITRIVVAQRSTHICSTCQKLPRDI
ncbi:MAG: DNA-formamidopyrimidine glycosylase [Chlamydiales bacterium]|nr:DNA-formamidopyrimidine glycosylase [Chlamydiales bacterium]